MGKAGITAVRRLRKSDNLRVARACGATIVNRTDEITEDDIGTKCGLFEVRKIGDEYFTFLEQCKDPKACTILLRGASRMPSMLPGTCIKILSLFLVVEQLRWRLLI